jgi:hypothetical protein
LIPVVELLINVEPGDNEVIMDLLFTAALVHGLDKLRMHTGTTLAHADRATRELGQFLRNFAYDVCPYYSTTELPKEEQARIRRQQGKAANNHTPSTSVISSPSSADKPLVVIQKKQRKEFNLNTYKIHSLGDYPSSIRRAGTTDNWTTQLASFCVRYIIGCIAHMWSTD